MVVWTLIGGLRGVLAASVALVAATLAFTAYDRWIDDPAVVQAATKDLVAKAELDAANSKNTELTRQLTAGRKATAGFADLLADAQAKERAADMDADKRNARYEAELAAAGRAWLLTRDDIERLRHP